MGPTRFQAWNPSEILLELTYCRTDNKKAPELSLQGFFVKPI